MKMQTVTCPVCHRSGEQFADATEIGPHLDLRPLLNAGVPMEALIRLSEVPGIEVAGLQTCSGVGRKIR
jgi:hypothetical protein